MMSRFIGGSSRVRQDLLRHFLTRPEIEGHAASLSRVLGHDAGGLSRQLRALEREGILASRLVGRTRVYRPASGSPFLSELRTVVQRTLGVEGRLREALQDIRGIDEAFIFGSYAAGTDRAGSDVDLMVIGDPDSDDLRRRIAAAERELERDVNVVEYRPGDLRRLKNDPFVSDVLQGQRVDLISARGRGRRRR